MVQINHALESEVAFRACRLHHGRRMTECGVAGVNVRIRPVERPRELDPAWRRWLAENLLLGAAPDAVAARLVENGCTAELAWEEIAAARASPYFQAGFTLRNRLAKRDWHLALAARHEAMDAPYILPRLAPMTPDRFFADHYAAQRPALIGGMIDHWPAMRDWSLEHIEALLPGDPEIEVQSGREGDADYEINATQHRRRMTLSEVLAVLRSDGVTNDLYVTAGNGAHNRAVMAPLWEEIGALPGILVDEPGRDGFFWMGPKGTVTPWHHDLTNNLLVQIRGRKRVTLVSSSQTALMRNHRHCYSLFAGDARFAGVREAERPRAMSCVLEPGDALFLPVGWWHHVLGLETTIGLSFTNFAWPNDCYAGYSTYDQV